MTKKLDSQVEVQMSKERTAKKTKENIKTKKNAKKELITHQNNEKIWMKNHDEKIWMKNHDEKIWMKNHDQLFKEQEKAQKRKK